VSTRATYQIGETVFYCHWDGYPTGAAQRFANMVAAHTVAQTEKERSFDPCEDRRGGWPFAFIRGNLDAEPTEDHEAHGDTEFRYTLQSEADGTVYVRTDSRGHDSRWRKGERIDLADWLASMRRKLANDLWTYYQKRGLTSETQTSAAAHAEEAIPTVLKIAEPREYATPQIHYATRAAAMNIAGLCSQAAQSFPADNPNKKIYQARAAAWLNAVEGRRATVEA